MSAKTVANYIKHLAEVAGDAELSPVRLQKLLYYSYAYYLVFQDKQLFSDNLEKWENGPVVPTVWALTKRYNFLSEPIEPDHDLSENAKTIIEDVFRVYGQYTAWKLRDMTHEETPWLTTPMNRQISDEKIKEYFEPRKEAFVSEVEDLEDIEESKTQTDETLFIWDKVKGLDVTQEN